MDSIDYFKGAGVIGVMILFLFVIFFIILAPLIVAILITNSFHVTGIYWWAMVLVIWFIIAGILSKLS